MAKIKLDLKNKGVENKLSDGEEIGEQMIDDPNRSIVTHGNALLTGTNALRTDRNEQKIAEDVLISKTTDVNATEKAWDETKRKAAAKTTEIYPDDVDKWKLLGWKLADPADPIGELDTPANFSATQGDAEGELDLHWDGVKGKSHYNVRISTDVLIPVMNWPIKATPKKTKITLTGLVSGTKYWLAVTAVGTAGESAPSVKVDKVAP